MQSASGSCTAAPDCGAAALLEHPAFADCHASTRRGGRRGASRGVHVPTEVSELLVDALEGHGGVWAVVCGARAGVVRCSGVAQRVRLGCGRSDEACRRLVGWPEETKCGVSARKDRPRPPPQRAARQLNVPASRGAKDSKRVEREGEGERKQEYGATVRSSYSRGEGGAGRLCHERRPCETSKQPAASRPCFTGAWVAMHNDPCNGPSA